MTRLLLLIVLSISVFSCNDAKSTQQELELKAKELELKEKELELRENQLPKAPVDTTTAIVDTQTGDTEEQTDPESTDKTEKQKSRKLKFLYYSPVGLRAYFDDGTIIACPRCELTKENIQTIKRTVVDKSDQKYIIETDGSLLIDGWKHEYPSVNKDENFEGWAMINYKWHVKY